MEEEAQRERLRLITKWKKKIVTEKSGKEVKEPAVFLQSFKTQMEWSQLDREKFIPFGIWIVNYVFCFFIFLQNSLELVFLCKNHESFSSIKFQFIFN